MRALSRKQAENGNQASWLWVRSFQSSQWRKRSLLILPLLLAASPGPLFSTTLASAVLGNGTNQMHRGRQSVWGEALEEAPSINSGEGSCVEESSRMRSAIASSSLTSSLPSGSLRPASSPSWCVESSVRAWSSHSC